MVGWLVAHARQPSASDKKFSVSKMKHKSAKSFKKLFISPWFFSRSHSLRRILRAPWKTFFVCVETEDNKQIRLSMVVTHFFFLLTYSWWTRNALAVNYKLTLVRSSFAQKYDVENRSSFENMFHSKWMRIIKKLW